MATKPVLFFVNETHPPAYVHGYEDAIAWAREERLRAKVPQKA